LNSSWIILILPNHPLVLSTLFLLNLLFLLVQNRHCNSYSLFPCIPIYLIIIVQFFLYHYPPCTLDFVPEILLWTFVLKEPLVCKIYYPLFMYTLQKHVLVIITCSTFYCPSITIISSYYKEFYGCIYY